MIGLVDIEEIMPESVVSNDYFGEKDVREKNRMFSGTNERRHWTRDELASDHLAHAASTIIKRLGLNAKEDIGMILTNVSIPDEPFTGCGAVINKKINGSVKHIFDIHNTGCVSFIYLMEMANVFMEANQIESALICISQTSGGRIFGQKDTKELAQSAIPGDGCAVAYVKKNEGHKVLKIVQENFAEYSQDMYADFKGKKWWEAREVTGSIAFDEEKTSLVIGRGNRLVPQMIHRVCDTLRMKTTEIDYLITNQPNKMFLRNWREAVCLAPEKHLDTFEKYANLFGAGIPVTLSEAIKADKFIKGDKICLAGFSHAGDYSAALIMEW